VNCLYSAWRLTALRQAAMAGAAPLSLAHDLAGGSAWSSSRAHTVLVQVLRLLPLDVRARAACVCRSWRDAAADPALFAALWFDDSSAGKLSDAVLSRLCMLAGAALRELRLNAPACDTVSAAGVLAALRAGGCAGVQRLMFPTGWRRGTEKSLKAEQTQELAAACPALTHTACCVRCDSAEDVATACDRLPGPLGIEVWGELDVARAALQLPAQLAALSVEVCPPSTVGYCCASRGAAHKHNAHDFVS